MEKIGKYEVIEELGKGGMGVVYKAHDPQIDRQVAIKVILERSLDNPEFKARFLREARTAGKLSHENIAIVHDFGEIDGKTYIVMEYLAGQDLRSIIDEKVALSLEQKLEYSKQICRGLQYAHSNGVIHRDIKPENIKILDDGRAKIIDFGIAKPVTSSDQKGTVLTQAGFRVGTPWYMSPEQVRGGSIDKRSDIFSFGVLLYEFLTYKKPFEGDDTTVMYKIIHEDPDRINLEEIDLVEDLQVILSKCLGKKPEQRYGDCSKLTMALVKVLDKLHQEKRVKELLAEAHNHASRKEYQEAVLKYNEILNMEPGHAEANKQIKKLIDREKESSNLKVLTGQITGNVISHFKIIDRLGGGGMGVVYKAEDITLKRTVALKFLSPDLTRDEMAKKRFFNEAQAASALDHPNICTIHEINETEDGLIFICMSYYGRETLKDRIAKSKLSLDECLDVAIKAARGIAEAHNNGIVHRDIKPANILLTADNEIKIVDFGLAKLSGGMTRITQTGMTMGTVPYMSPEQVKGVNIDHRTDIWSLGVLLYELLTGELPFEGEYQAAVLFSIVNNAPAPITHLNADIPKEVEQIVAKALKKEVDQRYASMQKMLDDLQNVASSFSKKKQHDVARQTDMDTLVADAKKFLKKEKYDEALSILNTAVKLDPKNEEIVELRDQCRRKLDELENITKLLNAGKNYLDKGKPEKAGKEFQKILDVQPAHKEAAQLLKKLDQEADKGDSINKLALEAKALVKDEKHFKAVELYNKILSLDPENESAKRNLELVNRKLEDQSSQPTRLVGAQPAVQKKSFRPMRLFFLILLIVGLAAGGWYVVNMDKNENESISEEGPDPEIERLSVLATTAKQEMLKLKQDATNINAMNWAGGTYNKGLENEKNAEQEFANGSFETARNLYGDAAENFRQSITEAENSAASAESDLGKIDDLVASVKQRMFNAKRSAENAQAEKFASDLFRRGISLEKRANQTYSGGTKEHLLAAQKDYASAVDLFRKANERAIGMKAAEAASASMQKAKEQIRGNETEKRNNSNYVQAENEESSGKSQLKAGNFQSAEQHFKRARQLFSLARTDIEGIFRENADQAKQAMLSTKSKIDAQFVQNSGYQEASKIEAQAEAAYNKEEFGGAANYFKSAENAYRQVWDIAQQQIKFEREARSTFENIRSQLKGSLENKDVEKLSSILNLRNEDQKLWKQFFSDVQGIDVNVQSRNIKINQSDATADIEIKITYRDNRRRQQENIINYSWLLQNQNGTWNIAEITLKN